jgi:hypothetical protein
MLVFLGGFTAKKYLLRIVPPSNWVSDPRASPKGTIRGAERWLGWWEKAGFKNYKNKI